MWTGMSEPLYWSPRGRRAQIELEVTYPLHDVEHLDRACALGLHVERISLFQEVKRRVRLGRRLKVMGICRQRPLLGG